MSAGASINLEINRLSSEILSSAAKINRQRQKRNFTSVETTETRIEAAFSLNNFAGYLSPDALFNVQKISLSVANEENSFSDRKNTPEIDVSYAFSAYQQNKNLLEEPQILIDYEHKNNRRYDYMV